MPRTRVKLEVYVDLDPIPGTFHSVDSARNNVAGILSHQISHYNPTVSVGRDFKAIKDAAEDVRKNPTHLGPLQTLLYLIEDL